MTSVQSIALELTIRVGSLEGLGPLYELMRIKGVSWDNPPGSIWFVAYADNRVVGSCCYVEKNGQARFKSDAVLPAFRGQGIYKALSAARLKYADEACISRATSFSSKDSRRQFLNDGFIQVSENARGIAFMSKVF